MASRRRFFAMMVAALAAARLAPRPAAAAPDVPEFAWTIDPKGSYEEFERKLRLAIVDIRAHRGVVTEVSLGPRAYVWVGARLVRASRIQHFATDREAERYFREADDFMPKLLVAFSGPVVELVHSPDLPRYGVIVRCEFPHGYGRLVIVAGSPV